jgi:Protein of unknown function (DUF1326)
MKAIVCVTCLFALLSVSPGPSSAGEKAQPENKVRWKISGELEEACSCRPACPCWFKSKPSRMTCDGVQAVFIKSGKFGRTPLDGLAVGQFVQSPEGKSMFESFGSWNFDNVYIDARANEEQRVALKEIAAHLFAPGAKERKFHFVNISRRVEGPEHAITVGTNGGFSGHLISGGYGSSPKITNVPLADPTHREFLQGETTSLKYTDSGQGWDYEHSNYMFNRFKVSGREYEKYEAELAKKMADGKM